MLGLLFHQLEKFVNEKLGPTSWLTLMDSTGVKKRFQALNNYSDSEFMILIHRASGILGLEIKDLQYEFGHFIVSPLCKIYAPFISPEWTALDLLENTESAIHRTVRLKNPNASPPALTVKRLSEDEVEIIYRSPRKLCRLAQGIIVGIGARYDQQLEVREPTCMKQGAEFCTFRIRLVADRPQLRE